MTETKEPIHEIKLTPIQNALLEWLKRDAQSDYERDRLHYGSDLWPGKCERAIWYAIHGTPRDEETLGSQLRFKGGRIFESALVSALKHAGLEVQTQVLVRPLRPSTWAWAPGHADLVVVPWKKLIEVVAPRAALFRRAGTDPRKLVKEQYRWQVSAYFHELRRRGLVEKASVLFLDREGANQPVEVEMTDDLLVPLEEIVREEERKARLLEEADVPARVRGSVVFEVLKGGRATAANPAPQRVVRSTSELNWQCRYCPFRTTCDPGPEERPITISSELRGRVVAEAERRWAAGVKRVVIRVGEESEFDEGEPREVNADAKEEPTS
ncbi:MAG TPA: hypothetical protein VFF73_07710 [Planctomycetota bacterium]|nr:hypothetical protein [Planctomycetota bacterium]